MIRTLLVVLPFLTIFSFCTKTKERIIDKEADPVYDTLTLAAGPILDYKINTSSEAGIHANVDNTNGKITVYLPYFYQLQFMEPAITVENGFTITPSADELVPVFGSEPFKYTIKDTAGNTKEYEVNIVIQQPDMTIREISTATSTVTLNPNNVNIYGQNMIPSNIVTSLHLFNSNGEEVGYLAGNSDLSQQSSSFLIFKQTGGDVSKLSKNTDYWIELRSYTLIRRMQYPVRFAL